MGAVGTRCCRSRARRFGGVGILDVQTRQVGVLERFDLGLVGVLECPGRAETGPACTGGPIYPATAGRAPERWAAVRRRQRTGRAALASSSWTLVLVPLMVLHVVL